MLTTADLLPAEVGLKVTVNEVVSPAAKLVSRPAMFRLNWSGWLPPSVMIPSVRLPDPAFSIVKVCAALLAQTVTEAKLVIPTLSERAVPFVPRPS